jgi:hypothetical protein
LETKKKKPLVRLKYIWEDDIKMDLKEFRLNKVDSELSPLTRFCKHGNETSSSRKGKYLLNKRLLPEKNWSMELVK